jgi:hypothetical protein
MENERGYDLGAVQRSAPRACISLVKVTTPIKAETNVRGKRAACHNRKKIIHSGCAHSSPHFTGTRATVMDKENGASFALVFFSTGSRVSLQLSHR